MVDILLIIVCIFNVTVPTAAAIYAGHIMRVNTLWGIIYDDYNPTQFIINEQETSYELLILFLTSKDMKNYQNNLIPRYRIDNNSETLVSIENQVEVTIMDFLNSSILVGVRDYPKVCVNLQTDVR